MSLHEIFDACGTDKGALGFGPFYERHLDPRPRALLEFGIAGGHSLLAWKQWGVERVEGVDIRLVNAVPAGVRIWQGDATDRGLSEQIAGSLDAIIDDASHNPLDVIETFWLYRGHVTSGGYYVVENTRHMGALVHDLLTTDVQHGGMVTEVHIYPDITFARMK